MSFVDSKTIEPGGVDATPFAYKLSDAEAIAIQSAVATFDGSLAAGNFLACMSFLAPDGALIARCPADSSVTAGDVAEVTFAPFLRSASSGSGSGISVLGEQVQQSIGTTPVANNTNRFIEAASHVGGPVFATFGGSANTFSSAGLFSINAVVQLRTTPWTAGGGYSVSLATSAYNIVDTKWVTFPNNSGLAAFPQAIETDVHFPPLTYAIGDQFFIFVQNLDGALPLSFAVQLLEVIGYH